MIAVALMTAGCFESSDTTVAKSVMETTYALLSSGKWRKTRGRIRGEKLRPAVDATAEQRG